MTPREQKRREWQERGRQLLAAGEASIDLALAHLDGPDEAFGPPFGAFQQEFHTLIGVMQEAAGEVPTELAEQYALLIPRYAHGSSFLAHALLQYRRRHHPRPEPPATGAGAPPDVP